MAEEIKFFKSQIVTKALNEIKKSPTLEEVAISEAFIAFLENREPYYAISKGYAASTSPQPKLGCKKCGGSGKKPVQLLTSVVYDPCDCQT